MNSNLQDAVKLNVLNKDKIIKIHEASLTILENTGVKIDDEMIRGLLADNGARINNKRVYIPADLVEKALDMAPEELILYDRQGEKNIVVNSNNNNIYFGTHADMLKIIDPFSREIRNFLRTDTELMIAIGNELTNISFILAVGLASDVPRKIQSQIALLDTIKYFKKTINFSSNDLQGLKDQLEILTISAGSLENFKQKPFAFYYCEPIPPLYHPRESTEKLRLVTEAGVPVVYMPYCMLGGTAPVTFSASLAQSNAEVLSGLVISQLLVKGSPFIYGAMPSIFDMKTTIGSYGAPEFHLLVAAASELADYYKLPFYGTAGSSDAKVVDEQAVMESTMSCFSSLMSKANIVHDLGIMDHCNSISPEMLMLINEILNMLKPYRNGVIVNDSELALDVIDEIGPANHYLSHEHTFNNFRRIWYPELLSRAMDGPEKSEISDKIRRKISVISERENEVFVSEDRNQELAKFEENLYNNL